MPRSSVTRALDGRGHPRLGRRTRSRTAARDLAGFEQGAKGVDGGAVKLVSVYAD